VAELAYARVSSEKQSLERQIHALTAAGIDRERIYVGSPWFRVSGDVVLAGHAASRAVA